MLDLRRRHSRWRMFSILLFFGMICSGELAPVREEISSSTPAVKKKDIGSLTSDFWQAWLLSDTQANHFQPSMDSATLLRRITPKSVFIAPGVLPACAEGYHADNMGRCVKSISLNVTAHKNFLLGRLNNMFGISQVLNNDQKKSTGPLQLNIPLLPDTNPQPTKLELEETFLTNQPVVVPTRNETHFTRGKEKMKPHETNLYEVKNDTTLDEEKSTFFLGNPNIDKVAKVDRKPDVMIPIAEFIEETNDTNFSGVVDYRIPIDLKALLNSSSVKRVNVSDGIEESVLIAEKRENSTEMSPALVLLISPTKMTNVVDDLSLTQNDTIEQVAQISNSTSNATTKENITVGALDSALLSTKQLTSIPLDEQRDNETYAEDELATETPKPNESQETEFYDEEEEDVEYPYSTDMPDDEDSAEGEEILKHGEAGMTIPTRNVERLDRDRDRHQRQRNQTTDLQEKMLDISDQVMIRFNDSAPTEDKDEAGSNISSEVSIDGDFILETTLLDVNTERLQVTTKSPDVTQKIVKNSEDDFKESFDKSSDVVPEVVFSEDAYGAMSTSSHGHERTEQLSTRIKNERNEELEAAPSSSESLLYDSPEGDPITEITEINHPINEKRSKESVLQKSPKDSQSNILASSFKQTTMNFDSAEDFVRFPDYARPPQQGSYVRFPSSEANSIHSLSYKQNSRYPADDVGSYGGTSTKSSVPIRQKPVYYLTASSWKPPRSQPDRVQAATSEKQKWRPDLIHFWSKLPLIRDPDIYPVYQNDEATDDNNDQKQLRRARPSRRLSPFTETSPERLTQKRRTPIDV